MRNRNCFRHIVLPFGVFLACVFCNRAWSFFSNYNTILIGDRAAGMGGAYTSLTDDPAASSFYNPAALGQMEGSSLSTAVNLYAKSEVHFEDESAFESAPLRVNQGSIIPIPSSSGTVHTFGNFAFGISILFPYFDQYTGQVKNNGEQTSFLSVRDESLWVGGSFAVNLTKQKAIGVSIYYTSRTFSRSISDRLTTGSNFTLVTNEKTISNNALIYIIGYYWDIDHHWHIGLSHRFQSLEINGRGSFSKSLVSTDGSTPIFLDQSEIASESHIPSKSTLGISYTAAKKWSAAFDLSFYDSTYFTDLSESEASDTVIYKPTWNINLGLEYYFKTWLAFRCGVYSNFSAHPEIPENPQIRLADHIDMWGTSANIAIFTSESSSITLGGYYTGGQGHSVQQIGNQFEKVQQSKQMFTFLVGTAYKF